MHSTQDSQVPFENYGRLLQNAPPQTITFVREGDYHFICEPQFSDTPWEDVAFSNAILQFLQQFQ